MLWQWTQAEDEKRWPVCYATETHCKTMWVQRRGRNATRQDVVWAEEWFGKGETSDKRQSETEIGNRYCKGCRSKQKTRKTNERKYRQKSLYYQKSAKKSSRSHKVRLLLSDTPTKSLSCIPQGLHVLQTSWACGEHVQKKAEGREKSVCRWEEARRKWASAKASRVDISWPRSIQCGVNTSKRSLINRVTKLENHGSVIAPWKTDVKKNQTTLSPQRIQDTTGSAIKQQHQKKGRCDNMKASLILKSCDLPSRI